MLAERRARLGPNLSLSYRRPLAIVRGYGAYLYDPLGQAYLDTVNNVAHVGHSHPRVVAAAAGQLGVLTTNTRYLHPAILRYAQRLTALLPEPLRVCYFVNSGSEANELALRLARAYTGRSGLIVVEAAYHGNTAGLIDTSPYKHAGPGGQGAPAHVQVLPMPDVYRGLCRDPERAGPEFGRHAAEAVARLQAQGPGVAAFMAESILSCGGQIVLPTGALAAAYAPVRAAGGVCIADEVQVGFGRVGSHFWAFETQAVVPDIVTLGKPIGNGFPLGAVITTPAIAAAFDNGMEYFNTFGGSPAAAAVGLAVLDVLADEGLPARAERVGQALLAALSALAGRHPAVGDARGLGLFLGVELVSDPAARTPAGDLASYVAQRMRDRGVLMSTDGPHHNVLKIKPPLVFGEREAEQLLATLEAVLGENYVAEHARA
jgi:4-aminobutyrate aminotransferase-like enzyme